MIMAVASSQVELLISLFFSEDDVNFSYVSYISTSGITTLHTQDIFLEKIKNHANNLIGDLMLSSLLCCVVVCCVMLCYVMLRCLVLCYLSSAALIARCGPLTVA